MEEHLEMLFPRKIQKRPKLKHTTIAFNEMDEIEMRLISLDFSSIENPILLIQMKRFLKNLKYRFSKSDLKKHIVYNVKFIKFAFHSLRSKSDTLTYTVHHISKANIFCSAPQSNPEITFNRLTLSPPNTAKRFCRGRSPR